MHRFIFGRILGRQQKLGSQANLASWREVTTTRDSKILLLHLGNSVPIASSSSFQKPAF